MEIKQEHVEEEPRTDANYDESNTANIPALIEDLRSNQQVN